MQLKKFTMMAIFANIMCFNFPILFVNSNLITESFESTVSCGLRGEKPWKYWKEPVILHGEKVLTTSHCCAVVIVRENNLTLTGNSSITTPSFSDKNGCANWQSWTSHRPFFTLYNASLLLSNISFTDNQGPYLEGFIKVRRSNLTLHNVKFIHNGKVSKKEGFFVSKFYSLNYKRYILSNSLFFHTL